MTVVNWTVCRFFFSLALEGCFFLACWVSFLGARCCWNEAQIVFELG